MASPDPAPAEHASRTTTLLIGFTAAANLAVAWFFASRGGDGFSRYRGGWSEALQWWLALQLPPLLALALLIPHRTRAAGIGMALVAAAGLGLADFVFLTFQGALPYFFGWPSPQVVALVPIVVGMLYNGARAAKALDPVAGGRAALGAVLAVLLPAIAWPVTKHLRQAAWQTQQAASQVVIHNEVLAGQLVRTAAECARQYGRDHPATGFPSSLGALGPAGSGCLPEEGAAGRSNGYTVQYTPALPDGSGQIRMFTLCAKPMQFGVTGGQTFVVDDAGEQMGVGPDAPSHLTGPLPCAAAWRIDADHSMAGLKHCVLRFAAEHPDRGYPDRLAEIADEGTACLALSRPFRIEGDRLRIEGMTFVYLPGWPDADARTSRFAIYCAGDCNRMIDETGTLRGTYEVRLVQPSDPTIEELNRERPAGSRPNLRHLERRCGEADAASCFALGMALSAEGKSEEPEEALRALEKGCTARLGRACLEWGRLLGATKGVGVHMPSCAAFHQACALGDGEGCWIAGKSCVDEDELTRARRLFEEGCDRGFSMSCVAAAERDLAGSAPPVWPPARIVAALDKACSVGQPRGCVPLGRLYLEGRLVEKDLARARHYLRRACALAFDPESCEKAAALPPPGSHP